MQTELARNPENVEARVLLSAALVEHGSLEQADAELSQLLAQHPQLGEARKLLARVHLLRNDAKGAERVLSEAPAGDGEDVRGVESDLLSSSLKQITGHTDEAIALLERASRSDPLNVSVKLDLARAYLIAGRNEDALRITRSLPAGAGGGRGQQLSVLAETAGKDPAQAKRSIDALVAANPKDAGLLTVSGLYLMRTGNAASARQLLQRALGIDARLIEPRLALASISLQGGQIEAARAELQKVVELNASEPVAERAYLGLAAIALRKGDRPGARNWLERSLSANPAAIQSRLVLAELAFADNEAVRANAVLEQALVVTPTRAATLYSVGQVLLRARKSAEALERFDEATRLGFADAAVGAALALDALGRTDEAVRRLERTLSDQPSAVRPTALLVSLQLKLQRPADALARVAVFEKAGADVAVVSELRGDAQVGAKRHKLAADAYERAQAARPNAALAVKLYRARLSAALPNPEASLTAWLEAHPSEVSPRLELAEFHRIKGNRREAIEQYERLVAATRRPMLLNNLAWLYFEAGDGRAAELAREAHVAAPASAPIADTYGWILTQQGKAEEGLKLLEKAATAAPEDREVQYHYAAALARTGQAQRASAALRKLLDADDSFPSRTEAQALLSSLTS
jgi:cellulose synthase operon protein C